MISVIAIKIPFAILITILLWFFLTIKKATTGVANIKYLNTSLSIEAVV